MHHPLQSPPEEASAQRWPSLLTPAAWRFSIRELLLLTTTIAAIVAMCVVYYQNSTNYSESMLFREFGDADYLRKAAAPLHSPFPPHVVKKGLSTGFDMGDGAQARRHEHYLALPRSVRAKFMDQLHADAKRMIGEEHRGTIGGLDYADFATEDDLMGFTYEYHGGTSRGFILVRRVDVSDDEMHLITVISEREDRP